MSEAPAATSLCASSLLLLSLKLFLLGINYTLQLMHFSGILAERRHREKPQTNGSNSQKEKVAIKEKVFMVYSLCLRSKRCSGFPNI